MSTDKEGGSVGGDGVGGGGWREGALQREDRQLLWRSLLLGPCRNWRSNAAASATQRVNDSLQHLT